MDDQWFAKITYGQLLDSASDRFGSKPALTFEGRTWSFAELREEVDRVADAMIGHGVEPGDVVGLWMVNRPEWLFISFAAFKIGAVLLPINTALRDDDLRFILGHSGCQVLFMAERSGPVSYRDVMARVVPELETAPTSRLESSVLPALRSVVLLDMDRPTTGWLAWPDFLSTSRGPLADVVAERGARVSPDSLAIVMYTSGTTGRPKGVMHSHHGIRNVVDQANRMNARESDVILMFLPLFHAYAFYEGPLLALVTGARCVLLRRFDPAETLAALARERATMCFGFSTHFQDLLDDPAFASTDRSAMRASVMAVGPASMEPLARRVVRQFGGRVISGYGMTEVGPGTTLGFLDEDEDHSAATSGYPLPGYEFRIVEPETGSDCPRGTAGEVLIRSYQLTEGYLNEPALTAAAIDVDGWLHSGDMGMFLADGYLRIVGRYKDMLRVGGENVDPAEVEGWFAGHPAVRSCVLIGVPDARLDEVGCLCVVLAAGVSATAELREELMHHADGRLAAHKRPRSVVFVGDLPMTASGKLQRHALRDIVTTKLSDDSMARTSTPTEEEDADA